MTRTLARLATGLLTLPAALLATGGSAAAETITVPGCYGVVWAYCDPGVRYEVPVSAGQTEYVVPVCAGTCTDVPVPFVYVHVDETKAVELCVQSTLRGSYPAENCVL